jgi:hypothetical protein
VSPPLDVDGMQSLTQHRALTLLMQTGLWRQYVAYVHSTWSRSGQPHRSQHGAAQSQTQAYMPQSGYDGRTIAPQQQSGSAHNVPAQEPPPSAGGEQSVVPALADECAAQAYTGVCAIPTACSADAYEYADSTATTAHAYFEEAPITGHMGGADFAYNQTQPSSLTCLPFHGRATLDAWGRQRYTPTPWPQHCVLSASQQGAPVMQQCGATGAEEGGPYSAPAMWWLWWPPGGSGAPRWCLVPQQPQSQPQRRQWQQSSQSCPRSGRRRAPYVQCWMPKEANVRNHSANSAFHGWFSTADSWPSTAFAASSQQVPMSAADASQDAGRGRIASATGAPATMEGRPAPRPQRPRRVRASRSPCQVHGDALSQETAIAPADMAQESGTAACAEEGVQHHQLSHEQTSGTLLSDSAAEKHMVVVCDAA